MNTYSHFSRLRCDQEVKAESRELLLEAAWGCMTPKEGTLQSTLERSTVGTLAFPVPPCLLNSLQSLPVNLPQPLMHPPCSPPCMLPGAACGSSLSSHSKSGSSRLSFSCRRHTLYLSGILHTVLGYSFIGKFSRPSSQSYSAKDPDKKIPFQESGDLIK